MGLVKVCPMCRKKNPLDEWLCLECEGDLSGVSPVEESELDEQMSAKANGMKKCPSCSEVNSAQAVECRNCGWDLSNISSKEKAEQHDTGCVQQRCLALTLSGGQRIRVEDGDVVGRYSVGGDILDEDFKTVSKTHARFIYDGGKWHIEDLGTTNGTYINNARIPANKRMEILPGQKLSLSRSCKMVVEEE